MIIKRRDSRKAEIEELTGLLSLPLSEKKRFLIERELRFIKSGEQGEKDAAYFMDFYFARSRRWAVIHDLRLKYLDRVAQIDHLLINRFFDIYVLESKNFSYGVKITETGEFHVSGGNRYYAIESPIEQNKRHQVVLEEVIRKHEIMPRRLGIAIPPSFHCYTLISPKSRVVRPHKARFDTSAVIKADSLKTVLDERADKMSYMSAFASAGKISSFETFMEVARQLAALHKPSKIDYRKRFEIEASPAPRARATRRADTESSGKFYCFKCKKTITEKVAKFCWDNERRFGGRAYCFDCQKQFQDKR